MVHKLRISLNGFKPEIWRSFKINSDSTFEDLHQVIQVVMGWEDYHLYEFKNKEFTIGFEPEDAFFSDEDMIPSDTIKILDVLPRKGYSIIYSYDFGDSWEHKILVEEITMDEVISSPVCIAGEMSCPPEDCGGIWGYSDLLEVLKDTAHPEHDEMLEWLGGSFDPEYFNLTEVNQVLSKFRTKRKKK